MEKKHHREERDTYRVVLTSQELRDLLEVHHEFTSLPAVQRIDNDQIEFLWYSNKSKVL